jgi:hypothetical protein
MVLSRSGLSIVVLWIYTYNFVSPPSSPKVFSVSGISWDSMNRCRWWQFRYVQDKRGLRQCLSMYIFRWFQANDQESCISFTLEYMYNVWIAWQVAKVRKIKRCCSLEAAISNFIILEVKTSEKGGYSVTFSIR